MPVWPEKTRKWPRLFWPIICRVMPVTRFPTIWWAPWWGWPTGWTASAVVSGSGLIPSGAADPYGLRRQALAIINILWDKKFYLDLSSAINYSLTLLKDKLTEPADKTHD